jgi:predicted ATP-dependent serine protease
VSKQPFSLVRQVLQAAPAALDAEQLAVVAHRGSPIVVQGGPGTGKTTVLVEAALARIADGQNPMVASEHLNFVMRLRFELLKRCLSHWREHSIRLLFLF